MEDGLNGRAWQQSPNYGSDKPAKVGAVLQPAAPKSVEICKFSSLSSMQKIFSHTRLDGSVYGIGLVLQCVSATACRQQLWGDYPSMCRPASETT